MSNSAFKVVQDALASYNEPWKPDYEAAMDCRDVEDWLYVGNGIFDAINSFDEKHQLRVMRGELEFDNTHNEKIREAYRWWLTPCEALATRIESLRKSGFNVDHAEQFLSNCREAKGILTDDAEFFKNESLVNLRDEALDEHRAGESIECG